MHTHCQRRLPDFIFPTRACFEVAMGKPGGFFKKLKSKQQKQTAKKARGTSGAAKSDRIRKHNDAVDFYAAQRLADQLDNVSDTSSESSQESGDEMDDALGVIRRRKERLV